MEDEKLWFVYLKKVVIGVTAAGLAYVAYKAGEKSEKARHEGYQEGRDDMKKDSSETIHNVGRMIDREMMFNKHMNNKECPGKEGTYNEKPTLDRFKVRKMIEDCGSYMQKMTKIIGIIDQTKSLYIRGNINRREVEEVIGEIKAHITEIEKEVPITGEIQELRDIINEEIRDLMKFIKNN